MGLKVNEDTHIKTDIKSVVMLIAGIAIAVWAWSEVNNRLTSLETANQLFEQDLLEASAQKPIDQEQFMLLEHISQQVEKLEENQEQNMTNKVNIERLQTDVERLRIDVEKLKDSVRANIGKLNGDH